MALRVCGMRFPFNSGLKPRIRDVWRRYKLERNPKLFQRVCNDFAEYLAEHNSRPELYKNENQKGNPLTAPAVLTLVATWIRRGKSERWAWELSLGKSVWMDDAILEREGAADVRFSYDGENDGLAESKDMREMEEAEVLALARENLGEDAAEQWFEAWKNHGRGLN